uniref:ATP synthase subunit a n=1 Tax=Capros aper TaxID=206100 RepID=A4QIK4_9TELE|nr:ATP synthase F0 subunit 6 [Capros aper]BAF51717.1 ATPase subunit 6 [Capros aper]
MMLSFFDHFMSPVFLGVPLVALSLMLPWVIFPSPSSRYLHSRDLTIRKWTINLLTKQLISSLSPAGHKWALMFISVLMFIVTMNILGLLPYAYTPTTQLSVSLGLAVPLWLATVIIGFSNQPTVAFGHFLPQGTPTLLIPILIMIETLSLFIRPMALGVRLAANLTAGHLMIQLLTTGTYFFMSAMPLVAPLMTALVITMTILEIAVALIQAYVFVLLLTLYLQENI